MDMPLFRKILIVFIAGFSMLNCNYQKGESMPDNVRTRDSLYNHFLEQYHLLNRMVHDMDKMPTYVKKDGSLAYISLDDGAKHMNWIIGFYPGTLWYLYELTGDSSMKSEAIYFSNFLRTYLKGKKIDHDIGFIVNSAFGNAFKNGVNKKLNQKEIIYWADQLMERFDDKVGCFLSWDADRNWVKEKGWQYPVIIDNMMNLELLFKAYEISGDSSYYEKAKIHAKTTLKNHFREDYSSYHLVDYDTITGRVRNKQTVQGFSDSSAWARGQAWALYGYTMTYRFTKDSIFLNQAKNIATFILGHRNMPKDKIPYWDFDVNDIPNTYRDASSAAIIASALYELYGYEQNESYLLAADKMVNSLKSENYISKSEQFFILQHSVGSLPHDSGVDTPVNYADYYFLEALLRQKNHGVEVSKEMVQ